MSNIIKSLKVDDQEIILFLEESELIITAVGDCCSSSYILFYKDTDINDIVGKTFLDLIETENSLFTETLEKLVGGSRGFVGVYGLIV